MTSGADTSDFGFWRRRVRYLTTEAQVSTDPHDRKVFFDAAAATMRHIETIRPRLRDTWAPGISVKKEQTP